jgi:monovalent cation/hydrogen antiporter
VPYPIPLVLGGLALGLIPGIPDVQLDPELVLLLFLPPLLYSSAFFSDLRAPPTDARSSEVMRRVERELDLEESRLEV